MTREDNFHHTFVQQLVAYSVWKFTPSMGIRDIPLSSFPCFSLELGDTSYTAFDFNGKATRGQQEFGLRVYLAVGENQYNESHTLRSNTVASIEQFINTPYYSPPTMLPGDLYCIDRAELVSIDAWRFIASESRFVLHVRAKYTFSLFT